MYFSIYELKRIAHRVWQYLNTSHHVPYLLLSMLGWANPSVKASDTFNLGSPYNGHKGNPNLIHPPDTEQNIPPLPPLLVSMQRDRLDAIKRVSNNGGGVLNYNKHDKRKEEIKWLIKTTITTTLYRLGVSM